MQNRINIIPFCVLSSIILCAFLRASASTYGGVSYYGTYVRVFEVITVGNRRDGGGEMAELKQREAKAKPAVDSLGKELDSYFKRLFSSKSTYMWIPASLKKYPRKESGTGKKIYFELDDFGMTSRFVAVWAKHDEPWLPLHDLIQAVVKQWLWKERNLNPADANSRNLDWAIAEFEKNPGMMEGNLLSAQLRGRDVEKLKAFAESRKKQLRIPALKILALGAHISDPAYVKTFLSDSDKDMRMKAMMGLFMMPEGKGEKVLRARFNDIAVLLPKLEGRKALREYLMP